MSKPIVGFGQKWWSTNDKRTFYHENAPCHVPWDVTIDMIVREIAKPRTLYVGGCDDPRYKTRKF
jgi:hypothetical protein